MNRRLERPVACVAALVSACSLVVDELPLRCDEPSDCNALNEKYGLDPMDHCAIYQCRSDGRGCEKRAQDLDDDGFTPQVCHDQQDQDIDCDDSWPSGAARHPMLKEECDGIDNNCDGRIDEGLAIGVVQEQYEFLPGTITNLSATRLSDGRGLAIASVQRPSAPDPTTVLHEIWAVILDPEQRPAPKLVTADGFEGKNCGRNVANGSTAKCVFSGATAFASRNGLFTAASESAGCSGRTRVIFGLEPNAVENESPATWSWSQASSTLGHLGVEPDLAACEPGTGIALAGSRSASSESSALAAWWNPENSGLTLASLTNRQNTLFVDEMAGSTSALPPTAGDQAPALVALPGRSPSYLVAYATGDAPSCAGISVARVTTDSSGSPVPTQIMCLGTAGATRPVLAVAAPEGEMAEAGHSVGLAWLNSEGGAVFATLRAEQDGQDLEANGPRFSAAPAVPARALSLAWVPIPGSGRPNEGRWLLTWTDSCGAAPCLYGALLGDDEDTSMSVPFRMAGLNGDGQPLTVIQPSRQALALVRAESTSLGIGFLGCIDDEP